MEFLKEIKDRGYPTEYLLARIHGRRPSLMIDRFEKFSGPDMSGHPASARPQNSTWQRFLKERAWIYHQMNNRLRNIFRPYFMYSELSTLLVCLRYKAAKGSSSEIERILEFSLLSDKLRGLLKTDADVPAVLNILGRKAAFMQGASDRLEQVFLKDGFKGVEEHITDALFKYILSMGPHPLIRHFFVYIADSRNIITLQRYMKWDTTSPPFFIEGGDIKKTMLSDIIRSYNTDALSALIFKHTGLRPEGPDAACVDRALQRRLTAKIKKWERENPDTGLLLNYLWRCAMEARNLSIIFHGREIDRGVLREELVH